jgi:hypothetical protein
MPTEINRYRTSKADKPVDPIRPVINLTIARPAVEANGADGKLIDQSAQPLLSNGGAKSGIND